MDVPKLCLHKREASQPPEHALSWNIPWDTKEFSIDWWPDQAVGPFGRTLLALEAHLDYNVVTWHGQFCTAMIIYHTPIESRRPHRFRAKTRDGQPTLERIDSDCHWQHGLPWNPTPARREFMELQQEDVLPCWEGQLKERFSNELARRYLSGGDEAAFDYLTSLWRVVFERQVNLYRKLTQ